MEDTVVALHGILQKAMKDNGIFGQVPDLRIQRKCG
jgi:hypothetical protein